MDAPVPLMGVDRLNGEQYTYFVKVLMGESGYGGFSLFVHERRFSEEELKKMVDQATEIVNTVRIAKRREDLAKNRVPIPDPKELNEQFFPTDVDHFEGVMCDKFDFRMVRCRAATAEIEPTVKGIK